MRFINELIKEAYERKYNVLRKFVKKIHQKKKDKDKTRVNRVERERERG